MVLARGYLICATPRSGSFLLCEALKNTGVAGRPAEFMRRTGVPDWSDERYQRYFKSLFTQGITENGIFGMKVMWMHFEDLLSELQLLAGGGTWQEALERFLPDLRYIVISRRDKVLQAISLYKALHTQCWDITDRSTADQPLHFNFGEIEALRQEIELEERCWQHYFALRNVQPFTVVYEEFVPAYEQTALRILEYLNVPIPANLTFSERRLQKQADGVTTEWYELYHRAKQQQV